MPFLLPTQACTQPAELIEPVHAQCRPCLCVAFYFFPFARAIDAIIVGSDHRSMPSLCRASPFPLPPRFPAPLVTSRLRASDHHILPSAPLHRNKENGPRAPQKTPALARKKDNNDLDAQPLSLPFSFFNLLNFNSPPRQQRPQEQPASPIPPPPRTLPTPWTSPSAPPSRGTSSASAPTSSSSPLPSAAARATRKPRRSATGTSGGP